MRLVSIISIAASAYAIFFHLRHLGNFFYFLPVFFIHGIAYAGARLSRKTYLVDYAPEDERPTYVSVANTAIGIFTLIAAGFGFVSQLFGLTAQLVFFVILLVAAIILSFRLKSV